MLIGNDPFSLLFIGCFLSGLLFLLITALTGHIHGHSPVGHMSHGHSTHTGHSHTHHAGTIFSFVNPMTLTFFLVGFGFFGYVIHNYTQITIPFIFLIATISAFLIVILLLYLLEHTFGDSEAETVQDVVDRTGILGKVSLTIQEKGIGEILYTSPGGMRKSVPARSVDGQLIERDQEVIVINYKNGVASVDTWDHFVKNPEYTTTAPPKTSTDTLADHINTLNPSPNETS